MAEDASASKKKKKVTMAQGENDENGGSRSIQWGTKRGRSVVICHAPDGHNLRNNGSSRESQRKRSGGKFYRPTKQDPENVPENIAMLDMEDLPPLSMQPAEIPSLELAEKEMDAVWALLELKEPRISSPVNEGENDENGGSRSIQWGTKRGRSVVICPAPDGHNLRNNGSSWGSQRKRSGGKFYRPTKQDPENVPENIAMLDMEDLPPLSMQPAKIPSLELAEKEMDAVRALLELKEPRISSPVNEGNHRGGADT